MRRSSMDAKYFDALYEESDGDPWRFATSEYERDKYAATLAALPLDRYDSGLEIGCSIGVLTSQLAKRCDHLLATEPAARALDAARRRCADHENVAFAQMHAPAQWPDGAFDLILLSEVVYYLAREQVRALAERVEKSLVRGGHVELVHWTGDTDYPLSADEAVATFTDASAAFLNVIRQERTPDYRLDLFERVAHHARGDGAA